MKTVVLRVDASNIIGIGHVMRCLVLADRFRRHEYHIIFICRNYPGNLTDYIIKRGYQCIILPFLEFDKYLNQNISDDYARWLWVSQEQDASETNELLVDVRPDLLVVDHYGLDYVWELAVVVNNNNVVFLVVDDLANRKHECDYLLDQNYFCNIKFRYENLVNRSTILFLGPEYFLFSTKFVELSNKIRTRDKLENVFVFFGGADSRGYTAKIVKLANYFNSLHFHIVIGAGNQNATRLVDMSKRQKNVTAYFDIDYIAELINSCDLGICAGGVNTWERILLGLPTIVYSVAHNQEETCLSLHQSNKIVYMGTELKLEALQDKLNGLLFTENYLNLLKQLNAKQLSMVDVVELINIDERGETL